MLSFSTFVRRGNRATPKRNGAALIIISRTPTPLDGIADLVINEEIGVTLPRLIRQAQV